MGDTLFEKHGQLVPQEVLYDIAYHYRLTKHAIIRIKERGVFVNKIREIFLNPYLAYYNTDGTINIAVDETHYFVISEKTDDGKYNVITYKEPSNNNFSISDKRLYAINGYDRNPNYNWNTNN